MKGFLLFLIILNSVIALAVVDDPSATPIIQSEGTVTSKRFNPYKSHWLSSYGFEGLKYPTAYSFTGAHQSFKPSKQELWGGRIGVGGEVYLGAGFNTTSKIEGYYSGSLFSTATTAGPEIPNIDYSYIKKTGQIYGIDAVQSLGYLFDMKTKNPFLEEWTYLTVEPFIEAGIGAAMAYNSLSYNYDTSGTTPGGIVEGFRGHTSEHLLNERVGVGINFTATSGFYLYLKATQNRFDVLYQKTRTYIQQNGSAAVTDSNVSHHVQINQITIYALGGGYKF